MVRRRPARPVALRYDDGFRGGIATLVSLPILIAALIPMVGANTNFDVGLVFTLMCTAFMVFFVIYLVWTHLVFSRTSAIDVKAVAALQHQSGASGVSRVIGLRTPEEWAMFAAGAAMLVSILASIIGARSGGLWLPLLVVGTVGASWVTVVYAFALRYLRLHCGGETISFDIDEEPEFADFLSMAVMVSSVGAMSAGTPRTRAGLSAVRTHT
ncbi:MAG: DUF1345 domain-containing protein, partial [Leucobacter sp.]|nr:DUF1345 domain-containing protein [Leucobacter sp.]